MDAAPASGAQMQVALAGGCFWGALDDLTITMEQEASKLVEIMHGEREIDARQ